MYESYVAKYIYQSLSQKTITTKFNCYSLYLKQLENQKTETRMMEMFFPQDLQSDMFWYNAYEASLVK